MDPYVDKHWFLYVVIFVALMCLTVHIMRRVFETVTWVLLLRRLLQTLEDPSHYMNGQTEQGNEDHNVQEPMLVYIGIHLLVSKMANRNICSRMPRSSLITPMKLSTKYFSLPVRVFSFSSEDRAK